MNKSCFKMTVELESKSNLSISLYLKIIVDKLRIFAMVKIEFNYLPIRGINEKSITISFS